MDKVVKSELLHKWLDDSYLQIDHLEKLREEFTSAEPFSHIQLPHFLKDNVVDDIVDELTQQEYEIRHSDLFKFAQTQDFDEINSPLLNSFKQLLQSDDFIAMMEYITNMPLSDDVDALGNIYRDTDYLLCHDDRLERRKIAYILYLTELYDEEGGSLNLFDTEGNYPKNIVKKIQPEFNKLVFFKVGPTSFHEVEEIRGEDIYRASISGWFNND